METVYIDVDTQVDFMDLTGALYVPGSQEIAANIRRLLECASQHRITTMSPVCAHVVDDPEFRQFGPHCIEGTAGARRYFDDLPALPRVVWPADGVVDDRDMRIHSGQHYVLRKRTFPMFANPWAAALRARDALRGARCVVFGVATDVCVRCDVLDLCEAGAQVSVVRDAIAGINPDDTRRSLEDMQRAGARFVQTATLTGERFVHGTS